MGPRHRAALSLRNPLHDVVDLGAPPSRGCVDEAASRLRMQVDSKPEELDEVDRRLMMLKIEREALKKESDSASKQRLEKLEDEIADLEGQSDDMTARWKSEKAKVGQGAQLRETLDRLRLELANAQRAGDLGRARDQVGALGGLGLGLTLARAIVRRHGVRVREVPILPHHILDALAINILDQFFYALAGPSCHSHWHCVEQHSHHIRHGGVAQGIAATDRLTKHHIRIPCDSTQGHGHGCVDHGGQRQGLRPDLFLQCTSQLFAALGKHLARQLATRLL